MTERRGHGSSRAYSPCCSPSPQEGTHVAAEPLPSGGGRGTSRDVVASALRQRAVDVPSGEFRMGSEAADANPSDGEGPSRIVQLDAFLIDPYAVSNDDFATFVRRTGYVTEAEQLEWSYAFASFLPGETRRRSPRPDQTPWWCAVEGASWRAPEGPGSHVEARWSHPVVHVTWRDAAAFAQWAGGRLPSEAEWECAARGGLVGARFPWGDDLLGRHGQHRCNIWQGSFPTRNTREDGHLGTAPVGAFPPNGYGLYNMAGNVWEMCADWWSTEHPRRRLVNPRGPRRGETKVMRGGSYLCHQSYCNRYRVSGRTSNPVDSSSGNVGFRLVFG